MELIPFIKEILTELVREGVDWIQLALNRH